MATGSNGPRFITLDGLRIRSRTIVAYRKASSKSDSLVWLEGHDDEFVIAVPVEEIDALLEGGKGRRKRK